MRSGQISAGNINGRSSAEADNRLNSILQHASLTQHQIDILQTNLEMFKKTQEKNLYDSSSSKLKESISQVFFTMYETIFKKNFSAGDETSPIYQAFLTAAHIDEKLLTVEQNQDLAALMKGPLADNDFGVYTLKQWLDKIYSGEKDPSINEFGQDYYEVFREKKKRGEFTERDRVAYEEDMDGRLRHEIDNLFRLGQRLCFGQMGGYLPILHNGMSVESLSKTLVTPQRLDSSMKKILDVDYSAFHREIVYSNSENNIKNELVMLPVRPDIILMPTIGSRAVMWQELTGRAKNTPARLLFPLFTNENLDEMMLEVIAKFRWSLSKSMVSYINKDIQQHTLFTDYYDYLQFYKKNTALSPEAREKIKNQIDKHRKSVADIFAADYQTWINYESKGLVRLNKVARSIMFKYCPFSKEIRSDLEKHPLYSKEITSYHASLACQRKITEARYAKLRKPNITLDHELEENLAYLDM